MAAAQGQMLGGDKLDYLFGIDKLGWNALHVVRFHAIDELSRPFEYDITLVRSPASGPLDLDAVLDAPASIAIATGSRFRLVHGVVAEAEELELTTKALLYRVLLVPHFWRARFRRRCRNFVDKPLAKILSVALEGSSADREEGAAGLALATAPIARVFTPDFDTYHAPRACYRWSVAERGRIDDPKIREYVVQYNESDFDFASRLLEEEGITYHFEHDDAQVVMTLTDRPGHLPEAPEEARHELRSSAGALGLAGAEFVHTFGQARRMRSRSVQVRDFSHKRTLTQLEHTASMAGKSHGSSRHYEFPGGDEDVSKDPCAHPAQVRLRRFEVERNLATGSGTIRTMEPGRRFTLHDSEGPRDDADYVVVRVITTARQQLFSDAVTGVQLPEEPSFQTDFTVLPLPKILSPEEPLPKVFSPEDVTPKPLIFGVQSAIVTAEGPKAHQPEIEADPLGSVRVRFPWDQEPETGAPSSAWIRVSQMWAGTRFGGLHTPRVGQEVLVAYHQGNPDRPVIVGRVYNAQSPPPYNPQKEREISSIKSRSSPHGGDGFNELRFQDLTGQEEVFLHAQRNLTEQVLQSHATSVGADQSISVGHDQSTTVTHDRKTTVNGDDHIVVDKDRDVRVTQTCTNDALDYRIQANFVGIGTGGAKACRAALIEAKNVSVKAAESFSVDVGQGGATMTMVPSGIDLAVGSSTKVHISPSVIKLSVGATVVVVIPNIVTLNSGAGATVTVLGSDALVSGDSASLEGTDTAKVSAAEVTVKGAAIALKGGNTIEGTAPAITWNK